MSNMMPNIDKFKIKKIKEIVPGNIVLLKINNRYWPGTVVSSSKDKSIINCAGRNEDEKNSNIFSIYYNDSLFVGSIKQHNELIHLIELSQEPDQITKAQNAYTHIAKLRGLASIEESNGIARLLAPVKLDKKIVGYLMQRAVNASQGLPEKATEMFLQDLKKHGLSIINI